MRTLRSIVALVLALTIAACNNNTTPAPTPTAIPTTVAATPTLPPAATPTVTTEPASEPDTDITVANTEAPAEQNYVRTPTFTAPTSWGIGQYFYRDGDYGRSAGGIVANGYYAIVAAQNDTGTNLLLIMGKDVFVNLKGFHGFDGYITYGLPITSELAGVEQQLGVKAIVINSGDKPTLPAGITICAKRYCRP